MDSLYELLDAYGWIITTKDNVIEGPTNWQEIGTSYSITSIPFYFASTGGIDTGSIVRQARINALGIITWLWGSSSREEQNAYLPLSDSTALKIGDFGTKTFAYSLRCLTQ